MTAQLGAKLVKKVDLFDVLIVADLFIVWPGKDAP